MKKKIFEKIFKIHCINIGEQTILFVTWPKFVILFSDELFSFISTATASFIFKNKFYF